MRKRPFLNVTTVLTNADAGGGGGGGDEETEEEGEVRWAAILTAARVGVARPS